MSIDYHEMRLNTALAALEQREQRELYRGDGRPLYSPEEQAERLAALRAPAIQATHEVERAADETIVAKKQELQALEHVDPLDGLSPDELTKAAALATFIAEDAERLPIPELVGRMHAAAAAGDTVKMTLLLRYAQQRNATILAAWRERGGRGPSMTEAEQRRPLADALDALAKRLDDPKRAERLKAAQEGITAASKAKFAAINKRMELDGTAAKALEARRDY